MTIHPALRAWLSLSLVEGLGNEGARTLLKTFSSPEAIFSAPPSSLEAHVKPSVAAAIKRGIDEKALAPIQLWLDEPGNHVITLGDSDYPSSLLNIPDPPLLFYAKGRIELLHRPALCIVGSRNATPQGLLNSESFSRALSAANFCIVSGLAQGIDSAAHRGALTAQGSSIAVVGTGLDRVYPASNRTLAHQLASDGLLISEYPLGTPPLASNFPRRNRIISGLTLGCLVVEASLQSGSLITARLAAEQGRDVFAIPGSIHSPQSKGCHKLIQHGAKLVETAQDVLDEISPSASFSSNIPVTAPSPSASTLSPLLDHVGFEPVSMDVLVNRSGLTLIELSAMLLELELSGHVSALPGGLYQRIKNF